MDKTMSKARVAVTVAVVLAIAGAAAALVRAAAPPQQRTEGLFSGQSYSQNPRYDGRFAFVRMSYAYTGRQIAPWSHDYPTGESHFLKILTSVSNVSAHMDETIIMGFSDPELFKNPTVYLCEPGFWTMTDSDVTNLRAYLLKGGFLIVDDFPEVTQGRIDTWGNFDSQMSRVFPEGRWIRLDKNATIFHSFFEIDRLDNIPTAYHLGSGPQFWGLFEDNDPNKRMYAIANYMNDVSEFWQYSETGRYLIQDANEAYKFGVNEFLYGITH